MNRLMSAWRTRVKRGPRKACRIGGEQLESRQLLAADLASMAMPLADIEICSVDESTENEPNAAAFESPRGPVAAEAAQTLRVFTRRTYIPNVPFLVRAQVEVGSDVDRSIWNDDVQLSTSSGDVAIDHEELTLVNGLGSTLVTTSADQPFTLSVQWQGETVEVPFEPLDPATATTVSGTLAGNESVWSGVVNVTGDVIVPSDHTLTIDPGTIVLVDGLVQTSREQIAPLLRVQGTLRANGTADSPVTITATNADEAWGELHTSGGTVELSHTTITRAGNSDRGGHTNTGPALRVTGNGTLTLDHSNVANISGKIGQLGSGQFNVYNSLMTRAVMGPELNNTGLDLQDSWLVDMAGRFHHNRTVDDNDGIYLHSQRAGQTIELHRAVVAGVQDDAIDTLGSDILLSDSIVRDATDKLISVFNGETTVERSLLVNAEIGIETKGSGSSTPVTNVRQSTIADVDRAIRARDKDAPDPNVLITYNISNSILHVRSGGDALYTDYDPVDLHVNYSWANESWDHAGSNLNGGNLVGDPQFEDMDNHIFLLPENSPAIDAGDPTSDRDPDGTIADLGYRFREQVTVGEPGDFNDDGAVDILDVDLLCTAINIGGPLAVFDVNNDGAINRADMDSFIGETFQTTRGDVDLDGKFDTRDLVAVFQIGGYEDGVPGNSTWSTGDWNCDGDFTTADMVAAFQDGGYIG